MLRSYSAIIAAGGAGERFGGDKLRQKVGGKAVLSHSLDRFEADDDCVEVIVCAGTAVRDWVDTNPLIFSSPKLRVVDGGASRAESVRNGAQAAKSDVLAIHDAARPNFTPELLERLKRAVAPDVGAVPVLPAADTLAYIEDGAVSSHVERARLHLVQTPQFFYRESYLAAIERAADLSAFGDDSALYMAAGYAVTTVPGLPGNLKLTTQADLVILLKLMGGGEKKSKDKYGGLGW